MGSTIRQSALSAARSARLVGLALLAAWVILASQAPAQAPSQGPKSDTPAAPKPQASPLQVRYGTEGLPRAVIELREAMESAIEAGQIEELRHAYEMSDLKPDLGAPTQSQSKTDPVAHWRSASGDGQGRDVLAALSLILEAGYVVVPRGADVENNKVYIWPYFAEIPLSQLTPRQEVELLRLVPASVARDMKEKGRYTHWRLVIGADGTWHALRKGD